VLLDLYCTKSYFWAKAYMAFEPFGWAFGLANPFFLYSL
jgi:hypothetical protein